MILAHCLVVHFLGRGWRYDCDSQICTAEDLIHRKIGILVFFYKLFTSHLNFFMF